MLRFGHKGGSDKYSICSFTKAVRDCSHKWFRTDFIDLRKDGAKGLGDAILYNQRQGLKRYVKPEANAQKSYKVANQEDMKVCKESYLQQMPNNGTKSKL